MSLVKNKRFGLKEMFQRNASKFVTYKNPCISFIFQIVQLCTNLYPMKALVYVDHHKYVSCMTWKTKISVPFLYIKCRKSLFIISIKNLATTFLIENWQVQLECIKKVCNSLILICGNTWIIFQEEFQFRRWKDKFQCFISRGVGTV